MAGTADLIATACGFSNKNIITGLNINSSIVYAAVPVFGLIVSLASINEEIKLCKVK